MAPDRRIVTIAWLPARPPTSSTMVDSTPISHGPPSMMSSTSSPRSALTSAAVVGLTQPNLFADGAASPPPKAASRRRATGCAGMRIATVSRRP